MEFAIVLHVSEEMIKKMDFTNDWNQQFKAFFQGKEYGKDISSYLVGVTCVSPQFEPFFKVRKPTYIEKKIETHDDFSVEISKSYGYDIKLDFNVVLNSNKEDIKKILASEIKNSLSHLDSLPKKIKDFNKDRFKGDLLLFFEERNLI